MGLGFIVFTGYSAKHWLAFWADTIRPYGFCFSYSVLSKNALYAFNLISFPKTFREETKNCNLN